ncbi:MAG TPA: hypothetical protein VLQ80_31430, partial [Candidatus Saccharimonadia bacterium]|nr:hypothetical protein [Candidatus Saccharimonadia bacterium]
MIIPGNALLALLNPPQESQATGEEKGGFGTLLTEIEQHATSRPDQEETERRALESVLQVLMNIFQSCAPANLLPVAAAPGTGESGVVSMRPGGGLPLGLPPGRGTTPALWETGEVNLPSGMVADGAQDIGQLAFPALEGQSTGSSPAIAGAPENFSWLLHRSESTQDLSGLFMAQPTAALSVSTPTAELSPLSGAPLLATTPSFSRDRVMATAEAQFVSPGLPQTSLATAGERPEAVGEPLLPPLSPLSAQTAVGTQEEISQSTSLTSQLFPVGAVHAVPWVGQTAAPPVAAAAVPLPTIPQTDAATTSDGRGTMALVQEDTTLAEYD